MNLDYLQYLDLLECAATSGDWSYIIFLLNKYPIDVYHMISLVTKSIRFGKYTQVEQLSTLLRFICSNLKNEDARLAFWQLAENQGVYEYVAMPFRQHDCPELGGSELDDFFIKRGFEALIEEIYQENSIQISSIKMQHLNAVEEASKARDILTLNTLLQHHIDKQVWEIAVDSYWRRYRESEQFNPEFVACALAGVDIQNPESIRIEPPSRVELKLIPLINEAVEDYTMSVQDCQEAMSVDEEFSLSKRKSEYLDNKQEHFIERKQQVIFNDRLNAPVGIAKNPFSHWHITGKRAEPEPEMEQQPAKATKLRDASQSIRQ